MTAPAEATKPFGTAPRGVGATSRRDRWWFEPGVTAVVFTAFILYSLFSAFLWLPLFGAPYEVDGYLSPFFSPLIGQDVLPSWLSPAILILWIPLGFRTTCYYYRKAYYRAFFADPPACAVSEPTVHKGYAMETRFPFILQNLHRLFLYLAFIPLFFLFIDAFLALRHDGAWRLGLGGVLLFVNAVLLAGYSFSCHSLRHLAGGTPRLLLVHAAGARSVQPVAAPDGTQREPRALGVGEPGVRRRGRPVHPPARARPVRRSCDQLLRPPWRRRSRAILTMS